MEKNQIVDSIKFAKEHKLKPNSIEVYLRNSIISDISI